jgi:hypothetical protein
VRGACRVGVGVLWGTLAEKISWFSKETTIANNNRKK